LTRIQIVVYVCIIKGFRERQKIKVQKQDLKFFQLENKNKENL